MKTASQYPADSIELTAPSGGVVSGTPYLIGRFFGVCMKDAAVGDPFDMALVGVYDMPHTATETFAEGDIVYWNDSTKKVTSTAGGNTAVGAATAAVAGTDATAPVRIPLDARA